MKNIFLIGIGIMMTNAVMAAQCGQYNHGNLSELLQDVSEIGVVKYACDNLNLESGQKVLGGAYNVYVNSITGTASVTTIAGFAGHPAVPETIHEELIQDESKQEYNFNQGHKASFRIEADGVGFLSYTFYPSWGEFSQRFQCHQVAQ